jgi:DnaJ-domain-containing protein 1
MLLAPSPGRLDDVLRTSGIDPEDVRVDRSGLTGEQRRIVQAMLTYAARLASTARSSRIPEAAAELAHTLTDGRVTRNDALKALQNAAREVVEVTRLEPDTRLMLMRIGVDLATLTGMPSPETYEALLAMAVELGIPVAIVDELLGLGDADEASGAPVELEHAAAVLGVAVDATMFEIKAAYRSLMLRYHPDHVAVTGIDAQEATLMAQRINAAYEVMIEAQRTQAA